MKSAYNSPVTVAVVCLNEEKNIGNCLKSLVSQSYKPQRVLVVDNGSTDKTTSIVKEFQRKYRNIKLIINAKKSISISRNIAVDKTKTSLLAFTDADCIAPSNWLRNLVGGYKKYKAIDQKVVAVGGSNIPPKTSFWYQTLSLLLNSFWGTGTSIQGRVYQTDRLVTHIPCVNILVEKEKIKKIGSFDESLGSIIEDEDMTFRLRKKGYRLFYISDASVIHNLAPTLGVWLKKMIIYGKGRALFIKKHPQKISLKFLASIFPVASLFIFFFFPVISLFLLIPYLFLTVLFSTLSCFKNSKYSSFFPLFFLYFLTHFFYGIGAILGLIIYDPGSN